MNAIVNEYQVSIDADAGNNSDGQVTNRDASLFLCVYDVRNRATVDYLKSKVICTLLILPIAFQILPEVKNMNKKMAVAGLGLEYRTGGSQDLVDRATASSLAKQYECPGMELVCCECVSIIPFLVESFVSFVKSNAIYAFLTPF